MSVNYYLACEKCQECYHIAHHGLSGFAFYYGELDCMKGALEFMGKHTLCEGNDLKILAEYRVEDFKEIE